MVEAGPAASWKGTLGELCPSDKGSLSPAVPPAQEGGPSSLELGFLVANVRGTVCQLQWMGEKPSLACPGLAQGVQWGSCPRPSD